MDFIIASLFLLVLMAYYGIAPTWGILIWPACIAMIAALALGAGRFLAALNVRYRDVKYALPFGIQTLLFLTSIIYPTRIVPEQFRPLMALNPLTGIVEACRASLLPTQAADWGMLAGSALITSIVFVLGALHFRNAERTFADFV